MLSRIIWKFIDGCKPQKYALGVENDEFYYTSSSTFQETSSTKTQPDFWHFLHHHTPASLAAKLVMKSLISSAGNDLKG